MIDLVEFVTGLGFKPRTVLHALDRSVAIRRVAVPLALGAGIGINIGYLRLIRHSQRNFNMDYCAQLAFDNQSVTDPGPQGSASTVQRWSKGSAARHCV